MSKNWFEKYKHKNQLHGKTPQERTINEKIREFDQYIKNAPNRFLINIDKNTNEKHLITVQDVTINNKYGDEKYIVTYNQTPMDIGSVFNCLGLTWIIVEKEHNSLQDHQTFKARPCNHMLHWLNSKGDPCSSPVIIESATKYSDGTWENAKIKIGDTRVLITFPANDETNQIQIGKRFLLDKTHAYEISDTGVTSPPGLHIMVLTQTEIHEGVDNLDLLIADYYGNAHEYSIETLNKSIVLTKNSTCKLQVNVLDKGVKIDNPELIFDVVDKDIITITGDTITGLNKGNTSIIVRFKDITDTINIEVTEVVTPDVYNIEILGKDSLALNRSTTYNIKFYKNGIEESSSGITWNITDENNNVTNYASIVSSDDSKCTVKTTKNWIFDNSNASKYFYLHCKSTTRNIEGVKKVKITAN